MPLTQKIEHLRRLTEVPKSVTRNTSTNFEWLRRNDHANSLSLVADWNLKVVLPIAFD
jgi:hypothetical protein